MPKPKRMRYRKASDYGYVYDGTIEIYRDEILSATLYYQKGFLYKIHINHYYFSGHVQFVREITRKDHNSLFLNTGVLEAYYPDGRVFDSPITEDGRAIIILNDEGEPEDLCECMDQDIMPWGEGYLSAFLGDFYWILEEVYRDAGLSCCWE
jgi:hypothetical protein